MVERIEKFSKKHNVEVKNIMYFTHKNDFSHIYLNDGREVRTKIPLKYFLEFLPQGDFHSIAKGIIVAEKFITKIEDNGIYTMSDGTQFQGRKNQLASHKRLRKSMEQKAKDAELAKEEMKKEQEQNDRNSAIALFEKCSVMEEATLAFCIIEVVFVEGGHGIDFIFRYCNKEMAVLEGIPIENMINKSFYEVFPDGDRKWIVPYADVALNGAKCVLHEYSPEVNKNLTIHCFQPIYRFCACILMEDEV